MLRGNDASILRVSRLKYLPKWQQIDQFFFAEPLTPQRGAIGLREIPGLGHALDPAKIRARTTLHTVLP